MQSIIKRTVVKSATTSASIPAGSLQQLLLLSSLHRRFHTAHHQRFDGKIVHYKLADIGEGITEVELIKWFIQEGQTIKQFDTVAEVMSDKANVDISSRFDGVVKKLHYKVGDIAKVGEALIDIEVESTEESTEVASGVATQQAQTCSSTVPREQVEQSFKKVLTTPAVRRIARENGIDLTTVPATGRQGRVLKEDVLNFLKGGTPPQQQQQPQQIQQQEAPAVQQQVQAPVSIPAGAVQEGDRVEPIRGLARAMVKTMTAAAAVPHLGLSDEVQMDALMQLREQLKPLSEEKLTFMPFFIKAASLALNEYPILNSQISADQTQIIYKANHNIGFAMDTPQGLLVPNIKNVQNLTVFEIAKELNRLIALGRDGKLGPSDLKGGTFTLSNIGAIGGTVTRPVLTLPEVCIGGIGKTQKLPRFNEKGEVVPAHILTISWSADHRIIDGASITRFSNLWKAYLEEPLKILYGC